MNFICYLDRYRLQTDIFFISRIFPEHRSNWGRASCERHSQIALFWHCPGCLECIKYRVSTYNSVGNQSTGYDLFIDI